MSRIESRVTPGSVMPAARKSRSMGQDFANKLMANHGEAPVAVCPVVDDAAALASDNDAKQATTAPMSSRPPLGDAGVLSSGDSRAKHDKIPPDMYIAAVKANPVAWFDVFGAPGATGARSSNDSAKPMMPPTGSRPPLADAGVLAIGEPKAWRGKIPQGTRLATVSENLDGLTGDPMLEVMSPTSSRLWPELAREFSRTVDAEMVDRLSAPGADIAKAVPVDDVRWGIPKALLGLPATPPNQLLTWSRVFGQHLIANSYLSVVEMTGRDGSENGRAPAPVDQQTEVPSVRQTSSSVAPPVASLQGLDVHVDVAPAPYSYQRPVKGETADPSSPEVACDSPLTGWEGAMATDQFWAKRVLKLTCDLSGSCTAWVRDFDLHGPDMQLIVPLLQRHAESLNLPLSRIVINGHELWRGPAHTGVFKSCP